MNFLWGLAVLAALLASQVCCTELEDEAVEVIEEFRSIMSSGLPDIGIPVLEPAVIEQLPLKIKFSPFDANVVASNVQVGGVSAFEFTQITQIEGTNKLSVVVEVPEVDVNGEYDIDGKVKIGFIKVKLSGQGPLKLNIKGLKGAATADVLINADGSLHLNDLNIDSWTYDSIKIQLDNLFMGSTVNALINKLVPSFIKGNSEKISGMVETMGIKVINKYLDGIAGEKSVGRVRVPPLHLAADRQITLEDFYISQDTQDLLDELAVIAVNTGSLSTELEDEVAELIEDFRAIMPSGMPDINIPVLEPAVIENLPITIKVSPFNAKAVASNVQVAGVSKFQFTKLSQIEGTNKLSVEVAIPEVDVNGEYDLQGKVKIGFIKVNLNGEGPLVLTVKGLKGAATVDVLVNEDGSLDLNSLQVDSWSYDKISIQLDNLFNGGVMSKTVNSLINKLVPTFLKSNRSKINQMVEQMGTKVINQYLDGIAGRTSSLRLRHRLMSAAAAPNHSVSLDDFVISPEAQEILDQIAVLAVNGRLAIAA